MNDDRQDRTHDGTEGPGHDALFEALGTADGWPAGSPPVAAIVAQGRRDRRRLRAAAVAGTAAAVVAVVGGVALAASGPDAGIAPADQPGDGDAGQTVDSGPVPDAPEGMRWVGKDRAMVAVPASWATNAVRCGTPERDTVLVDPPPRQGCSFRRPEGVSSVELRRARSGRAEECATRAPCSSVVVSGRGPAVAVLVSSRDQEFTDQVLATAQGVPTRATVVPARRIQSLFIGAEGRAGYLRQLRRAGLEARPDRGLDPNGTFDIEPAPGSVVPEGARVRLVRPAG